MWYSIMLIVPFFFVFGLVFGSFSNALIYRIPSKEYTIFKPRRSICPICKHELAWKDNIPILSYFILKGRCRYCGSKISPRYPLVELITASLYVLNAVLFPLSEAISLSLMVTGLVISAFIDLEHYMIPDSGVILVGLGCFFWAFFRGRFPENLIGALIVTGAMVAFFLIANQFRKDSFGFGDVELLAVLSLATGIIGSLYTIMIASLVALAVYAITSAFKRRKLDRLAQLPFGPFIAMAGYLTVLLLDIIEGLYVF
ncbi:MAG: prepilin peptidase [Mesotoga sp.]|nr:A24 family peptidase [Mesotoga infera]MBP8661333.1 prepilin peptidase [Mesotoga sp.]NLI05738.1 prepilin peptidase [Thermotogaceae bacterium]HON27308.1 prepilin peptidase [Mesotoga infera]